jgi:hypothetical protein
MKLEDEGRGLGTLETEVEIVFNLHYLTRLGEAAPFVRLESKNF